MTQWSGWNPAAGFFHFSTKDVPYVADHVDSLEFLRNRVASRSVPEATKTYKGRRVVLPPIPKLGFLSKVLLGRRTWRQFGKAPLSLNAVSALLGLTFAAHKFFDLGMTGRAMLRTSPSAGACNPIEAYVVVRQVHGMTAGIYHYAPLQHELTRLRRTTPAMIGRHLAGQLWYGRASMLVLMTAVFARTEWKYPFARAYRTVLLEAGHFCQTFYLVATALGLAPFCSSALADSVIERDLGIDGISESVVYACGVGTRPRGVDWAPWPSGTNIATASAKTDTTVPRSAAAPASSASRPRRRGR